MRGGRLTNSAVVAGATSHNVYLRLTISRSADLAQPFGLRCHHLGRIVSGPPVVGGGANRSRTTRGRFTSLAGGLHFPQKISSPLFRIALEFVRLSTLETAEGYSRRFCVALTADGGFNF
jgi:hypothetical protein